MRKTIEEAERQARDRRAFEALSRAAAGQSESDRLPITDGNWRPIIDIGGGQKLRHPALPTVEG